MASDLSIPLTFSCALDSFLEIASCLFLPHLSNLTDDISTHQKTVIVGRNQGASLGLFLHNNARLFWLEIAMLASVRSLRK